MQIKFLDITDVDFDIIGQQLIRFSLSMSGTDEKWEYNSTVLIIYLL
jgi:hypothetical protein